MDLELLLASLVFMYRCVLHRAPITCFALPMDQDLDSRQRCP